MRAVASIGGAVIVVLAAGAAVIVLRARHRSELYPDPGAVRYRFPKTAPVGGPDPALAMRALEVQATAGQASPMDLADLAELYLQRGLLTGDQQALEKSETFA